MWQLGMAAAPDSAHSDKQRVEQAADDSGIDHMAYLSATSSADLMASP
jgi:hypothetical protein